MLRDCHSYYLKLYDRTRSFAVSLRQEGKVAWLESPNRLDALSHSPGLAGSKGLLATARFMVAMPNSLPSEGVLRRTQHSHAEEFLNARCLPPLSPSNWLQLKREYRRSRSAISPGLLPPLPFRSRNAAARFLVNTTRLRHLRCSAASSSLRWRLRLRARRFRAYSIARPQGSP